jgi:FAD/FMN-containing dehydrogenase
MDTLLSAKAAELRSGFSGDVLTPGDPGYEEARAVWNAMIDKRPAIIARCRSTADVVRTVNFARSEGIPLAVRGAGHNIAGKGTCDGGLLLDLSRMTSVTVDPAARRVTVEGGATLADVDEATLAHGLVVPTGINSTTGIGGLTLGGGFGWLSRKLGMTVDSLESAEVVSASGDVLRASATEHPDLFWALCGGGGNFGVVTRFEFRAHPVGPDLLSGLFVFPASEGRKVLQQYRDFMVSAPDDLSVFAVLRLAPPLPFLPESVHGAPVVVLALLYVGDPENGRRLVEPLGRFGTVLGSHVGVQPLVDWQKAFDPLLTPGARNYWKSHNHSGLADGLIDAALDALSRLPDPQSDLFFASLGGAVSRLDPESAAYPHRDARFILNVHGRWDHADDDERAIRWARSVFDACAPFATGGVYVNFLTDDEDERVGAAYGASYNRLARVKARYDPANLFHTNQNIVPA